jgi:hypothetical protein
VSAPTGPVVPTAKQRLQATRQALMHELVPSTRNETAIRLDNETRQQEEQQRREHRVALGLPPVDEIAELESAPRNPSSRSSASGWFAIARHSIRAWWEFHPVRVVGVVAEPVLKEYARHQPFKLVGIAAGLGALLVITRPWRMVSLGGLAVAALKSSQVSNFALSFLSSRKNK